MWSVIILTFKELSQFVIAGTLIICILIAMKAKKKEILTIDGMFSIIGFGLGLFITFLNLIYSNNYMITLGPILTIASVLYLRFRNKILTNGTNFSLNFNSRTLKVINILYLVSISIALFSYQQASPYYRPPVFFIFISFGVALLGLEILSSGFKDNFKIFGMIFKILLISLILRTSAYFISPYPIGSDPWAHADLINDIFHFGSLNVPPTDVSVYYVNYPLMHLYAVIINLIGNVNIKGSMFIIGVVLTLSTVFIYLIVKNITGNINLALLSLLMLNFADFHIQWSVEVIAMSFGIAIYTILLYLIMKRNERYQVLNRLVLITFIFIIVWTHTVSGFIALILVISLYVGSLIYELIYKKSEQEVALISFIFCTLFIILLLFHWMDPNYPFFDSIIKTLINSLSLEAKFLGRATSSNDAEHWQTILDILGFLIYIFFGIIGILYCLSKKYATKTKVSLIFTLFILFFIFFAFPVFGMRNILPYRWPAFIYVSFVLFTGIGLMGISSMLKSKRLRAAFILAMLFVSSVFMITNSITDMDSPFYGKEINQKFIWTDSEMTLFEKINKSYDGEVVADLQTSDQIFRTYLKRKQTVDYQSTIEGDLDWEYMNNKLVIWRKISLTRPVQAGGYRNPNTLLEEKAKRHLDSTFSKIYDTGEAAAYL